MVPEGWFVSDRLTRIRRSYLRRGIVPTIVQHSLAIDFGKVALAAFSPVRYLKVEKDADFVWTANAACAAYDPAPTIAGDIGPNVLIRFELTKNQRTFGRHRVTAADAPGGWIALPNIAGWHGTGEFDAERFYWPFPIFLQGGDVLQAQVYIGAPTAAPQQVFFTLHGYKIQRLGVAA